MSKPPAMQARGALRLMRHALLPLALGAAGCQGYISAPAGSGGPGDGTQQPGGEAPLSCDAPRPSAFGARRLTPEEYANAVTDIFGGRVQPSARYARLYGKSLTGFSSEPALGTVGESAVSELMVAAEDVGEQLVAQLPTLLPCSTQAADEVCALRFVDTFVRRAYRRTLAPEERTVLRDTFRAARGAGAPFGEAVAQVAIVALQSPQFLYHAEPAAPQPRRRTGVELASQLAFVLWASVPDDALLAAAEAGQLDTAAGVRAQAERMLQDARARRGLGRFFREWTLTQQLTAGDKVGAGAAFDAAVAASTMRGFDLLVEGAVRRGDSLRQLLTTRTFPVDAKLAPLMGLPAPTGTAFVERDVGGTAYVGLLTHPAVQASAAHGLQPSYVFRGRLLARRVLCADLGDPPGDAMATAAGLPLPPDPTAQDRSKAVRSVSTCNSCHQVLDPPGLAFEVFDGLGRPRQQDALGRSFTVAGQWDLTGLAFRDHTELITQVAQSPEVARCFATQLSRALTAELPQAAHACDVRRLTDVASAQSLRDVVLTIPELDSVLWKVDP